jgi:hypothetical protein
MNRLFWGGMWTLCLAAGAVSGVAAGARAAEPSVVREFVAPPPSAVRADLPAANLLLAVEPRAVRKDGRGELLELEVELRSNFRKDAVAQYSYVLVTDEGRVVQQARRSPLARLGVKARQPSRIATPSDLPDGFYQVRVDAVASDADEDVVVNADRYFRVEDRAITPLSASEFFAQSNANRARI